jgi:hypothetical protein
MAPLCSSHSTSRFWYLRSCTTGGRACCCLVLPLDLSEYLDKQRIGPPFRPGTKMYP